MISVKIINYISYGVIYYKNSGNKWVKNRRNYRIAKEALEKHYGNRCLFCNRMLNDTNGNHDHYSIEHLQEKSNHELLASNIQNLVLSCVGCNGTRGINEIGETPISLSNIFSMYKILENGEIYTENPEVFKTIFSYGLNRREKLVEQRKKMIKYYKEMPFLLNEDFESIYNSIKEEVELPAVTLKCAELLEGYESQINQILVEYYSGGL